MIARILTRFGIFLTLTAAFTVYAEDINKPLPACVLSTLNGGQTYDLQQFKGKVVYVDFWASWCGSCAKSFPYLNVLNDTYKDKGLQIIGINVDENVDDAKAFIESHPAQFSVAADASKQCATGFGVEAMPSTFLIDKKGIIRYVHLGFRAGETQDLEDKVAQLLAE
ncbi:TlpA family protein disulfide reductase [Crenothrix polyspora]|uniref:Redoxin superfamily n=1 Tax=Crenothrix polyspora TaxID=360316 RepID=A0A1R4H8M1_9GAMM|nr:TlpA disulfide reductase family protein [Crenothrix polyspora]SJM92584.1 Redoxin superfamily [Crenothrix polyspora]